MQVLQSSQIWTLTWIKFDPLSIQSVKLYKPYIWGAGGIGTVFTGEFEKS